MHSGYAKLTAGLILAALAASLITIMSELPGTFTWGFVDLRIILGIAAAAGLALAVLGVWQKFGPPPKAQQVARANAALIYGAMLSLAGVDAGDGELNIDEVRMIQRCCQQFFQRNMTTDEIRSAHARSISSRFANFGFGGAEATAAPEARAWAYTAALMVAKADGLLSDGEHARLDLLAARLGLDQAAQVNAAEEAARIKSGLAEAEGAPPTTGLI